MKELIEQMIAKLDIDGTAVYDLGKGKFEVCTVHPRINQPLADYLDANFHVIGKENNRIVLI